MCTLNVHRKLSSRLMASSSNTLSVFELPWTRVKSLHVLHARHGSKGTGYIQLVCILTVRHVYTCTYLSWYLELMMTLAFSEVFSIACMVTCVHVRPGHKSYVHTHLWHKSACTGFSGVGT